MTKDEKLKKAMEALEYIVNWYDNDHCFSGDTPGSYAQDVYEKLTAPKMETVEVKRWEKVNSSGHTQIVMCTPIILDSHDKSRGYRVIEFTGIDQRPVEEKEPEVWEGCLVALPGGGVGLEYDGIIPDTLAGRKFELRLKEEE